MREEGKLTRKETFIKLLKRSTIAIDTAAANEQHYEVPAELYKLSLGPHRKYSCAFREKGEDLAATEAVHSH